MYCDIIYRDLGPAEETRTNQWPVFSTACRYNNLTIQHALFLFLLSGKTIHSGIDIIFLIWHIACVSKGPIKDRPAFSEIQAILDFNFIA
jgi:hypothetical protein